MTRILIAGRLHPWSIGSSLVRAARKQSFDVFTLAEEDHFTYHQNVGVLAAGPLGWAYLRHNVALRRESRRVAPDLIFVVKGDWIAPQTVQHMTRVAPTFLVSLDDFFPVRQNFISRRVRAASVRYTGVFTSKRHNLAELGEIGVRNVQYFVPGVDPLVHPRVERLESPPIDACFVGSFEDARAGMLQEAARLAPEVRFSIHGSGWPSTTDAVRPLYGPDKLIEFARSKSALSFLRRNNRDVITDRPFEIAACGLPLIAEWSEDQAAIFPPDVAALYFRTPRELVLRVRETIADPRRAADRAAVASRIVLGHSYDRRFNEFMETVSAWG